MKKILITGGGGYVGTYFTKILLKKNFKVTVFDTFFYGNFHKKNKNLKIVKGDIRNSKLFSKSCKNIDIVLHLACISNDPTFDLKPGLSKKINYDCFEKLVKNSKKNGVRRFIYASTSSVYGISKKKNIKENQPLKPITDYNLYKGLCEPILFKYADNNFTTVIARPATLCGYSQRCRLDLTVNTLTNHAYHNNEILIFGGNQKRPNLHIKDMCRAYMKLINANKKIIQKQIFNIGFRNLKVKEIANIVKKTVTNHFKNKGKKINIKLKTIPSNDNRSYHINSDKIKKVLNFKPKYNLEDAIKELCVAFDKKKLIKTFDNDNYYNIKVLKKIFK
jgi:nucleoside-diphosphate-sugar epimerase